MSLLGGFLLISRGNVLGVGHLGLCLLLLGGLLHLIGNGGDFPGVIFTIPIAMR